VTTAGEAPGAGRRLLVVSAHAADFVWRAGGYIALTTAAGAESPGAWVQPGMTLDVVKKIRQAEAEQAGCVLGAVMHFLDKGDHPLPDSQQTALELAGLMRGIAPDVIVTHAQADPYNYDHPVAADGAQRRPGLDPVRRGLPAGLPASDRGAGVKPRRLAESAEAGEEHA
jgi:LmbE family N-acetylglucosaminyl deacetylase